MGKAKAKAKAKKKRRSAKQEKTQKPKAFAWNEVQAGGVALGILLVLFLILKFTLKVGFSEIPAALRMRTAGVERLGGGLGEWHADFCGEEEACDCVAFFADQGQDATYWEKVFTAPREAWKAPVHLYGFAWGEDLLKQGPQGLATQMAKVLKDRCENWVILGRGMGAWVATWIAHEHQDWANRMILAAPKGIAGQGSFGVENPPYVDREVASLKGHTLLLAPKRASLEYHSGVLNWKAKFKSSVLREVHICDERTERYCEGDIVRAINDLLY